MGGLEVILGVDIGGTKTTIGVARPDGSLLAHKRVETPNNLGPDRNLAAIIEGCRQLIHESSASVKSIGVGCGGPLDRKTGVLHQVPNLPGWQDLRLTDMFSSEFDAPCYIDNDATAATLGELTFGAGRGVNDFVYFTISTGIGGGIVADGRIYRGAGENAGEFGHTKVLPDGPRCTCGDRGCLESLASGTSIARVARERLGDAGATLLREWVASPADITAELVARAASAGDHYASGVWNEAMGYLGLGVSNVVNCLNPSLVILGGGVTKAGDLLFEPVRRVVADRAMKPLASDVRIVPAANGDLTGLLGAIAVAITSRS